MHPGGKWLHHLRQQLQHQGDLHQHMCGQEELISCSASTHVWSGRINKLFCLYTYVCGSEDLISYSAYPPGRHQPRLRLRITILAIYKS